MKPIARAFLLLLFLVSCGDWITPIIDVDPGEEEQDNRGYDTTFVFTSFKDSLSMDIDIDGYWSISISPADCDWCSFSPASGNPGRVTIVIKTDENPTQEKRTATVTISAGISRLTFRISQNGSEKWLNDNWWDRTDRERMCIWGPASLMEYMSEEFRTTRFDESGHCLEDTVFSLRGGRKNPNLVWKHSYNASGKRIKTEMKTSSGIAGSLSFEYGNGDILVPTSYKCWLGDSLASNGLPMTLLRGLSKIELRNDMGEYIGCIDYNYSFVSQDSLSISLDIWKKSKTGGGDYDMEHEVHGVRYQNGMPYSSELVKFVNYRDNGMFSEYVDTLARRLYHETDHLLAIKIFEYLRTEADKPFKYYYNYKENWDLAEIKGCLPNGDIVQDFKYREYDYEIRHRNWCSRIIADIKRPDHGMNALNESRKFTFFMK